MMLLINILGFVLMAGIVWWFWLYHPSEVQTGTSEITISVNNGVYSPSRIRLPADQPTSLQFLRKDASPCAALLIIPDAQVSEELPLDQTKRIEIPALPSGEHAFHCQMQMYRGTLIVE